MVSPADSTVVAIRKKVRRLTASPGESALSTIDLDQYINTYYSQDFPYSVKTDQLRNVYTFYTEPNIDRYPLDVYYNQGVRAPVYIDGVEASYYKDRNQFYNLWPRWVQRFTPVSGDGTTTSFSFTIPGPFLSKEVTLGTVDLNGNPMNVADGGDGVLYLQTANPRTSIPPVTSTQPGQKNDNTANPGQTNVTAVGSVNYVSGAIALTYPLAPGSGQNINASVVQYQTSRPLSLLFWNNEFTVRPVPEIAHKIEVETYLTPVQFLETTDVPLMDQFWQLIAIGAAIKVLEDRQDMDGINNLVPLYDRQEALVLERQGIEEIGYRTPTIFSSSSGSGYSGGYLNS